MLPCGYILRIDEISIIRHDNMIKKNKTDSYSQRPPWLWDDYTCLDESLEKSKICYEKHVFQDVKTQINSY